MTELVQRDRGSSEVVEDGSELWSLVDRVVQELVILFRFNDSRI